jgi:peptide/nickel transport system substrate-binding protein
MGAALIGRRNLLQAGLCLGAWAACPRALAMGRLPVGGRVTLRIPHETSRLDPHDLFDPVAAIVAHAVFDTVYSLDGAGNVYPSLAEGMPRRDGKLTRVTLREGLRSARGRPLDARDLAQSVERARRLGAVAVLADIPAGTVDKADARTAVFKDTDPTALAHALTSPVLVLVSRAHSPAAPDGTGAFRAEPSAGRLTLVRNRLAARGPSCLEEIVLQSAPDLLDPVRAFESLAADVAWLGSYIHQPRPGSVAFDLGAVAWVVLRTGNEAVEWGAPGVAQGLCDAIPPGRLAHLALGRAPQPTGSPSWGGPACDLVASSASAHLMEIARSVASILSSPGHDVTATGASPAELAVKRRTGAFSLMLDVVRPVGPAGIATLLALATADQGAGAKSVARHPPKLGSYAPRVLARTLRLGVVGELRVSGTTIPQVRLAGARDGNGWDLGASWRTP